MHEESSPHPDRRPPDRPFADRAPGRQPIAGRERARRAPTDGAGVRVVVPVLDEAAALPDLFEDLAAADLLAHTLFVDNGSSDGGPALIAAAGAPLLREARRGYGYPCLTGSREACAQGAGVVVFMEADGSDDPADVHRLVQRVADGEADMVIGSRRDAVRAGGGMPPHQRLGNALALWVMRALFGLRIPDNGPFRAVRTDLLQHLRMQPRAYAWTTEMTVKAHLLGARIAVMEVGYRRRLGGSKIAGTLTGTLGAFAGIFGTMLRLKLCSARARRGPQAVGRLGRDVARDVALRRRR